MEDMTLICSCTGDLDSARLFPQLSSLGLGKMSAYRTDMPTFGSEDSILGDLCCGLELDRKHNAPGFIF